MNSVAVLLSTYNGSRFLEDFLESLCRQDFCDFDVIIRDDGSTDETLTIIDRFRSRLSIDVLKDRGNLGPAKSFMRLLDLASSSYELYMFADQDDWWHPNKISRCYKVLSSIADQTRPSLYFTSLEVVDESLNHIATSRQELRLASANALVENVATGCTMGINRSARALLVSALPSGYAMHDAWIYLTLSFLGDIYYEKTPSMKYRQHSSNSIGAAKSVLHDLSRRVRRFVRGSRAGVHSLSQQAEAFFLAHGDRLTSSDRALVRLVRESEKSLARSLYLFIFSPFSRQRFIDRILLRLLFLFGRY